MDVEVNYDSASGKRLQIVSQSGSKFLLDKVLKRAVDSEREAFQQKRINGSDHRELPVFACLGAKS